MAGRNQPAASPRGHSTSVEHDADTLAGKTFGPYQIEEKVGEGGMATVYRAYQPSLHRSVALKVLRLPDKGRQDFLARFEREAALLARFQHPNILPVFDYGQE